MKDGEDGGLRSELPELKLLTGKAGGYSGNSSGGPAKVVPGAGWALALLIGINLFNYIDRQILSATLSKIRRDSTIFPDLHDTWLNTKLGG